MSKILTMATRMVITASLLLPVVLTGCKKDGADVAGKPGDALSAAAVTEGKEIFSQRCTPCHGARGKGDGPASAALTPKPRNFGDAAWQKSVTDEHIEKIIVGGGAAVGKNASMPSNPDLDGKPDVVKALRAHIRGLK